MVEYPSSMHGALVSINMQKVGVEVHACHLGTREEGQEEQGFETIFSYAPSSRSGWATYDPVSGRKEF